MPRAFAAILLVIAALVFSGLAFALASVLTEAMDVWWRLTR